MVGDEEVGKEADDEVGVKVGVKVGVEVGKVKCAHIVLFMSDLLAWFELKRQNQNHKNL